MGREYGTVIRLEWFIFIVKIFYIIENLIGHAFQCQIVGLKDNRAKQKLVVVHHIKLFAIYFEHDTVSLDPSNDLGEGNQVVCGSSK